MKVAFFLYKELRQSLITRFPYAIFYLVEEEQKKIVIFGILHTSRNPENSQEKDKEISHKPNSKSSYLKDAKKNFLF